MDDVEQTWLVYGIDEAGNRSLTPQVLTLRIDNVTPVLSVVQVNTELVMTPDLAAQTVLTGSVSDGGKVVRMHAYVRDPEGIGSSLRPIVYDDLSWQVQLQPMKVGNYLVWVAAEDEAGNQTTAGPFAVQVAEIPASPEDDVEPLVSVMPTLTITPTQTITATVTVTATLTATPTETAIPTQTVAPTITPSPSPTVIETTTATLPPTESLTPVSTPTPVPTDAPGNTSTPTASTFPASWLVFLLAMTLLPVFGGVWSRTRRPDD
jgi:hypothetical protein